MWVCQTIPAFPPKQWQATGGMPTSEEENLPHQEEKNQHREKIVALVIKQVVDDAVVPPVQVAHVGESEPGWTEQKIIQTAEGWRLHACHFSHRLEELRIPECNAMELKWAEIVYCRRHHAGFLACGDVRDYIPRNPGRKFCWLWRKLLQNWIIECYVSFSIFWNGMWNGMEFRMYEATWGKKRKTNLENDQINWLKIAIFLSLSYLVKSNFENIQIYVYEFTWIIIHLKLKKIH